MSIILSEKTQPANLNVKTIGTKNMPTIIILGGYEITMEDFIDLAEYVLINTDLTHDDPRLQFVKAVQSMNEVDGYNKGAKHLQHSVPVR